MFWPKISLLGVLEVLGEPGGAIFGLNPTGCSVWVGLMVWSGSGSLPGSNLGHFGPHVVQKGTFRAKMGPFGAPLKFLVVIGM